MDRTAMELSSWDDEGDDFEPSHVVAADDEFERGAVLQGLWLRVCSQELRRGHVTAAFAGVTLDLRDATLAPEGATIHLEAAASGVEVLVPADWEVLCDVDAIFGGVADRRRGPGVSGRRPRLRLAGMIVASGLSIR